MTNKTRAARRRALTARRNRLVAVLVGGELAKLDVAPASVAAGCDAITRQLADVNRELRALR